MDGRDLRGMFAHFETLVDPRVERTRRHELNDIVALAVLAVISGADGFTDMHTFAETKLPWLKTFLNLHNGVPSHDTFGRVLAALDPDEFEQSLLQWTEALATESGGVRRAWMSDWGCKSPAEPVGGNRELEATARDESIRYIDRVHLCREAVWDGSPRRTVVPNASEPLCRLAWPG